MPHSMDSPSGGPRKLQETVNSQPKEVSAACQAVHKSPQDKANTLGDSIQLQRVHIFVC